MRHINRGTVVGSLIGAAIMVVALVSWPTGAQGPVQRFFEQLGAEPAQPAGQPRIVTLPEPELAKDDGALTLLVVGDFMARGLAVALEDGFADEPGLVVVDRTNGSSGLVRDDFYDWNRVLPDLIEEVQPNFVVLMVGTNDRQDLRTAAGGIDLRSEEWDRLYADRVNRLAETMALYGELAFWVGQPPMRQRSMSADMAYFNSVYEDAAVRNGVRFLDIWDAFVDQEGRYIVNGPDVDGQTRVLRGDDGFSLTRAGQAKVAFFVESEIQLFGGDGAFVLLPNAGGIEIQPDGAPRVVGPVMVLGDPPIGAVKELLDAPPGVEPRTLAYRLLVRGEALPHVEGRADDFTWPRDAEGAVDKGVTEPLGAAGPE